MLKLHGMPSTRSNIVRWYLEELGVPFEFVLVDLKAGAHRQPEYRAIHPMGQVPALSEGEFKLWESGAILLYLADRFEQMPATPEKRAEIYQWVLFGNATLASALFTEAQQETVVPRLLAPLNQLFAAQPFLLGETFSVADVAVGSVIVFALFFKVDLSAYPEVVNYAQRLTQRPAFQKSAATT
ncbi:glutathione S-transferase family protein [Anthocerotibacter panamensis]|uniref:glutathione S-transferase family protein n=1 Tax=Anthocerotibacter panamensis TaxID=2857077 RepID=UPI002478F31B|nr:glutathione S-transferase family protein [Anthocerotibacter panamensis]